MRTTVRVADEGSQVKLARDKVLCAVWTRQLKGLTSVLAPPQKSYAVQVDTMTALFYRVTLCALALSLLEVKGRPLARG